ncbi:MAG: peptide chain release factor 1 [Magnetococcales bacterium]|nr:peptide chain release factor 1 [Magnetococcales bacterium]
MFDKLNALQRRHAELAARLAEQETAADATLFTRLSREYAELDPVVESYADYQGLNEELEETRSILEDGDSDSEMREMATEELRRLEAAIDSGYKALQIMLLPKDPNEGRNVILEIRAGTGGEEAALFSADLFRMYGKFIEMRRGKVSVMSSSPTDLGGYKELIAQVSGSGVYGMLKYESGVHRVQRVPTTEAGGRIHTSACTVAILPEADEVDVQVDQKDLRIDVYRASGPGGQSVNTTDSAVRITHLPTGLVVTCQDEKSQHKNKDKAMTVLQSRLFDLEQRAAADERSEARRSQVGSGDRSERIRTYNFPQSRVTDHRINLTLHKLDQVLEGELDQVVDALAAHDQAEQLASLGEG